MPSGNCSVGGTCTWPSRPPFGASAGAWAGGIAPVMSLAPTGAATGAVEPSVPGTPAAGLALSFGLSLSLAFSTGKALAAFERLSVGALAAAACAARRAAAMKLDVLTDSLGLAAGISLSALSDAAMRSD